MFKIGDRVTWIAGDGNGGRIYDGTVVEINQSLTGLNDAVSVQFDAFHNAQKHYATSFRSIMEYNDIMKELCSK